jgi:aspartyl-tRNA(Asn)/glutamyl-tRNA(Gln) amidotransferase subunit A
MDSDELGFLPATELAKLYARRALSPVEVARGLLDRIEAVDTRINAMTLLTPEAALSAARDSEARYAKGEARLLEGIPVTIKDLHRTKGVLTEFGSLSARGTIPDVDEPSVARLKAAGTVMLGKTTVPEMGWKGVSNSPLTGITHNPWKHGYNAGASSAGAGAAAAAGYGPLHLGSDGAGSIRMPAHFCGVYGLKPTYGRIPIWPVSNNDLATHVGPMSRSVADSALMLQAMAGPHPWDFTSAEAPPQDYAGQLNRDMRGKRIAYSPDLGHARVDPEVAALVAEAVKAFEAMGATVEEVSPAWGPVGEELERFFWPTTYLPRAAMLDKWRDVMDPGLVALIEAGKPITAEQYLVRRTDRWAYIQQIHEFFEEWDFLLTPSVSVAAFPAERLQPEHWPQHPWDWLVWAQFSYPFNMSGNPAASLPCGFTGDGLPVGLQVVGKRFADLAVLQASAAFEEARPWAGARPPLALVTPAEMAR